MSYGRNSIASVVSDVRAVILKWRQICSPQEMIGNVWGRFWLHLGGCYWRQVGGRLGMLLNVCKAQDGSHDKE